MLLELYCDSSSISGHTHIVYNPRQKTCSTFSVISPAYGISICLKGYYTYFEPNKKTILLATFDSDCPPTPSSHPELFI